MPRLKVRYRRYKEVGESISLYLCPLQTTLSYSFPHIKLRPFGSFPMATDKVEPELSKAPLEEQQHPSMEKTDANTVDVGEVFEISDTDSDIGT